MSLLCSAHFREWTANREEAPYSPGIQEKRLCTLLSRMNRICLAGSQRVGSRRLTGGRARCGSWVAVPAAAQRYLGLLTVRCWAMLSSARSMQHVP
jgi:hypothetical protein